MKNSISHYRGIILWVDDNFLYNPLENDMDVWRKIFGGHSDYVFRLMNLQLRIATTYDDAVEKMRGLKELQDQGAYIFCVFDMNLPKNDREKDSPSSDWGIKLVKLSKEMKFSSAILTTASDIREELLLNNLQNTPYFQKRIGDQKMPDNLIQNILSSFRSGISWISIQNLIEDIDLTHSRISKSLHTPSLATSYFPYLSTFQDFVDRCEYRPPYKKGATVLFRTCSFHSDEFIQQCLLVASNEWILKYPKKIAFRYYRTANKNSSKNDYFSYNKRLVNINAIRVDTDATMPEEFTYLLQKARDYKQGLTFFILPDNETSDEYINQIVQFKGAIYEDLPAIRFGDYITRESFVRASLHLVIEQKKIQIDDTPKKMGSIYLNNPEILLNPISWLLMNESIEVAEELTDPYEIVDIIEQSVNEQISALSPAAKINITENLPIPKDHLLEIGFEIYRRDENIDFDTMINTQWIPKALNLWLTDSWRYPYGLQLNQSDSRDSGVRFPEFQNEWEKCSFFILLELVRNNHQSKADKKITNACSFLNHKTISALFDKTQPKISDMEWSDLLSIRWPYNEYPLPIALNKKLKEVGRYIWVESDNFDLSQAFPTTRGHYKNLLKMVDNIGRKLTWLSSQSSNLPEEWAFYTDTFVDWIQHLQIENLWHKERLKVTQFLIEFLVNALPICYLSSCILDGKFKEKKNEENILKTLASASGFGILINKFRPVHQNNLFKFKFANENHFSTPETENIFAFIQFCELNQHFFKHYISKILVPLKTNHMIIKIYKDLDNFDQEMLLNILKTKELTAANFKSVLDNITADQCIELLAFLKKKVSFKDYDRAFSDILSSVDLWGMTKKIIDSLLGHDFESSTCDQNESCGNLIKELYDKSCSDKWPFKDHKSLFQGDATDLRQQLFFSSNFEVFKYTLGAIEKFSKSIERINYCDGFHFLDSIRKLRNIAKGSQPEEENHIGYVFELFIYGIEGIVAQLKFLLEIMGEKERASKIKLDSIKDLSIEDDLAIPDKEILEKFINIGTSSSNPKRYRLYHLGIPGDQSKGKKAIQLKGKNILFPGQ